MKIEPLPPQRGRLADSIAGVWILKSREDMDGDGRIIPDPFLGQNPAGMLCFGQHHFAAQFMKRERSGNEENVQRAQARNNSAGVNGYDAYFGTYALDETAATLTTLIEGSVSPDNIGNKYTRDIRIAGNTLIIRLGTTAVDGTDVTRTNTFSRAD